jgi:hypothetical protein
VTVLTREQIKSAPSHRVEEVDVPNWGGSLFIHGLSGKGRDEFEMDMLVGKGKNTEINLRNLRARLIVKTAHTGPEPDAPLLFGTGDIEWLGDKDAVDLQLVYSVAQRLSGLSNEDVDEMTSTETLGNALSDASGSDSQDTSDTASPKPKK